MFGKHGTERAGARLMSVCSLAYQGSLQLSSLGVRYTFVFTGLVAPAAVAADAQQATGQKGAQSQAG